MYLIYIIPTELYLSSNQLTEIDVSNLINLKESQILSGNQLTDIDVSWTLHNLIRLYLSSNQLTNIDVLNFI